VRHYTKLKALFINLSKTKQGTIKQNENPPSTIYQSQINQIKYQKGTIKWIKNPFNQIKYEKGTIKIKSRSPRHAKN